MNISKNLLIKCLRGINHSDILINQYQIRELLKNNNLKIYYVENCSIMSQEWQYEKKKISEID